MKYKGYTLHKTADGYKIKNPAGTYVGSGECRTEAQNIVDGKVLLHRMFGWAL